MIRSRIAYDMLVQNALRGVVRQVLVDAARDGLPGEHHFFITFSTHMAGVGVSSRLKERYPEQMTIVLQHQFWDLQVEDDYFSVTLSFGDIPEKLVVPFAAVLAFYDPAAAFEAAFDTPVRSNAETNGADDAPTAGVIPLPRQGDVGEKVTFLSKDPAPVQVGPWRKQQEAMSGNATTGKEQEARGGEATTGKEQEAMSGNATTGKEQDKATDKKGPAEQAGEQGQQENQGGDVISLDAFRKK